jgi:hypothetical protein
LLVALNPKDFVQPLWNFLASGSKRGIFAPMGL